jgi:hypothetical protein
MKKLITAIAIGAFAFVGTAVQADARPYGGHGYDVPPSTIYVSGYRHGRPIYTQKYFIGYDSCGRPRFGYRMVSTPSRGYSEYGGSHCDNRRPTQYGGRYDSRSGPGASVSFSFRR